MRLTARVEKLASAAARAKEPQTRELGIVWSTSDTRVDREQAKPGEYVAVDLYIDEPETAEGCPALVRTIERFTRNERDLGVVFDAKGARVGRIVAARGGVLRWELTASAGG